MLQTFDRDDLVKLWSLVQERFNSTKPTEDKEREIWVELKRLFEPDADDELWKSQKHIHHGDITWRLIVRWKMNFFKRSSCGKKDQEDEVFGSILSEQK
nr:hypothetical protein [Tanacetum cinerariifolium]